MPRNELECLLAKYKTEFGQEIEDRLTEPLYDRNFLEQFLYGLITAHLPPHKSADRSLAIEKQCEARLSDALFAITGKRRTRRTDAQSDDIDLVRMAELHLMELRRVHEGRTEKPSSHRELARWAARTSRQPQHSLESTEERLRKKFAANKEELLDRCSDVAVAIHTLQAIALEDLEETLTMFKVPFFAYD